MLGRAAERAVAEPLMAVVCRRESASRGEWILMGRVLATCRAWRELAEPHAAARVVAELTAPTYPHRCADPRCVPKAPLVSLVGALADDAALGAWATRALSSTPPRAPADAAVQRCGALVRPDPTGRLAPLARVAHPGFVAALKRHMPRVGVSVKGALWDAARCGNVDFVRWLSAEPTLDPRTALCALHGVTDPRIVAILGALIVGVDDAAWDTPPIQWVVNNILVEAAMADDAALCAQLHEIVGFQPNDEVRALFGALVCGGHRATAQWCAENIETPPLRFDLLSRVAARGHLETLQWMLETLEPDDHTFVNDESEYDVLASAIEYDRLEITRWLVGRFELDVRADHAAVWRGAIYHKARDVLAWLADEFPIGWRALESTEELARRRILRLLTLADDDCCVDQATDVHWMLVVVEALGLRAADLAN